ncbi:breast carcinoma-amplified sequence 1 isoform X1 [Danio rerio]|nr:breast carcinoma-amplified sequence 1 [Danio rerio]XP_005162502.1 breast carcinoma-amplified sequence 1 isoform X1 [Danio rerio]XP_017209058.1 breast carcinoma-amplified sequence 1 isoform X1 [Danio rerio]AAH95855.1 Zgc:112994 [Danio rerio]|eukprot:NP_001018543.1 breast carcinoma-amplified sequence 1 [Danio rerio]
MGNEQSAQKKRQKANPEKKVHNGELNGHAVPTPDQTEPVAKKEAPVEQKSEAPPVTVKEEPKPPEKEEVDNSKANKPAHVETTPEKKITVTTEPEPPKKASPKSSGDEAPNFFGKMFKKKPEPVKPASEKNDTVDAPVTVLELKIDAQPDKVFINTDQKETELVDGLPAQPISSDSTKKSSSMHKAVTYLEVVLDLPAQAPVVVAEELQNQEPVVRKAINVGHLMSEEAMVNADFPGEEELKTLDAEKALMEDKELIKIVESIISEELSSENKPNDTKHLTSDADVSKEPPKISSHSEEPVSAMKDLRFPPQQLLQIPQEQHSRSHVYDERLTNNLKVAAEEPITASSIKQAEEKPTPAAFELALAANASVAETISHIHEEPDDLQKNKLRVVAEEPLTSSVEQAMVAEEEDTPAAAFELASAAGRATAVDEESWVVIEEQAQRFGEPQSKCNSVDSAQLFSQLRSVCTKVLEDASCKPLSVDVYADESSIHITIGVCLEEFARKK